MHTQREHAAYLLGRRAHYIVIVKAQPEAPAQTTQIAAWEDIPFRAAPVTEATAAMRSAGSRPYREQPARPRSPSGAADQAPPHRSHDRQGHHQDDPRRHQPDLRASLTYPARPADPRPPGASRPSTTRDTTFAETPSNYGPATRHARWPPGATSHRLPETGRLSPISQRLCGATHATPDDHSHFSASDEHETDITRLRRGPVSRPGQGPRQWIPGRHPRRWGSP